MEESIQCNASHPYRTIDGTCNNLNYGWWGSADRAFARYVPAEYGFNGWRKNYGFKALPNVRAVSNVMANAPKKPTPNISILVMQWGQFLNHDITNTPQRIHPDTGGLVTCCGGGKGANGDSYEGFEEDCRPIGVGHDAFYMSHDVECVGFVRSLPALGSCDLEKKQLEQVNGNTAFVDASNVYGSSAEVADYLRTKSGGRLNITDNNSNGEPMPPFGPKEHIPCPIGFEQKCFLAGDVRIDMVPGLIVMHTAFIRLHNIIADELASLNSHWNDETIYQETRRIIGALVQQITYHDWLPIVLGHTAMVEHGLYVGPAGEYSDTYDASVDPTIKNAFSAAAFRFGHSLVGDTLKAAEDENNFSQADHFFNISVLQNAKTSPSSMLKGMARCPMEAADPVVADALRNQLFASVFKSSAGLDLAAINLKRGRDHGVPGYSKWREFCKLKVIKNIRQMKKNMDENIAKEFKKLYHEDFEGIDLFAAGLSETPIEDDQLLGPTLTCIIAHQFADLKHGDRFWYERKNQPKPFTLDQLSAIRQTSFTSILCKVTEGSNHGFQPDPFKSIDVSGNDVMDCSNYKFIDLSSWKESGY